MQQFQEDGADLKLIGYGDTSEQSDGDIDKKDGKVEGAKKTQELNGLAHTNKLSRAAISNDNYIKWAAKQSGEGKAASIL